MVYLRMPLKLKKRGLRLIWGKYIRHVNRFHGMKSVTVLPALNRI